MFRRSLAVLVGAALIAQAPTVPVVVLTRLPGATQSALLEVDPVTGLATPLPGFLGDSMRPLAVAVDPFDGAVFVALDAVAVAAVQVVRLVRTGSGWSEHPLVQIGSRITQLDVVDEDLLVAFDGGVFRLPRRGGTPATVLAQANVTALHGFGPNATAAAIAWTGRPGTAVVDSGTGVRDLAASAWWWGPDSFPNPTARETTGIVDLPTAVPRQLLAFDDGTFALFAPLVAPAPTPVPTTPAVPPGGAVALKTGGPFSVAPLALGGAPFPFLYSVDAFSGAVTLRSAALPGDPVDFAAGIDRQAHRLPFGRACGPVVVQATSSGDAVLGTTLTLTGTGQPNALLVLALGLDDFAGGALPLALPGGCALEIAPDVLLAFVAGPAGTAAQSVAIPAAPALTGTPLFVQWGQLTAPTLAVSVATVCFVGV
jgi:hypothetical protein